jgi:hypothetical protein
MNNEEKLEKNVKRPRNEGDLHPMEEKAERQSRYLVKDFRQAILKGRFCFLFLCQARRAAWHGGWQISPLSFCFLFHWLKIIFVS